MWVERAPSGRWKGCVRLPGSKKKACETFDLKGQAKAWAQDLEAKLKRGDQYDPEAARVTLDDWYARWWPAHQAKIAKTTRDNYESRWRLQIQPHLGGWRLRALRRIDLDAWVADLVAEKATPRVIQQAITTLQAMLTAAADSSIITASPARRLRGPATPAREERWWTRHEGELILEQFDDLDPAYGALVELALWVGPRWGELSAIRGDRIDWLRGRLSIVDVRLRDGSIREYPKGKAKDGRQSKSRRIIPLPPDLVPRLARLMEGRERDAILFTRPDRKTGRAGLRYEYWRQAVWDPAIARVRTCPKPTECPRDEDTGLCTLGEHKLRWTTFHTARHTAATWLVQEGVDLAKVQATMGHESFETTLRYAHHSPDTDKVVLAAWSRLRDGTDN